MRGEQRRMEGGTLGVVIVVGTLTMCGVWAWASEGSPFALPEAYEAGVNPIHAAAGDLNGDGALDLVVADEFREDIWVLLNQGDGRFGPAASFNAGVRPFHVALGDLNNDGQLDAVIANYFRTYSRLTVHLGDGSGELHESAEYQISPWPKATVLADLNGDGWLDVVVETNADAVPVLLNMGDGSLADPVYYPVADAAGPVLSVDVDRDGWTDLVTPSAHLDPGDRAWLQVLRNGGDGQFEQAVVYEAPGVAESITSTVNGDFNGDGWPDVAFLASTCDGDEAGSLFVLLNQGDGSFAEEAVHNAGLHPQTLVATDLNSDGALDLALANWDWWDHDLGAVSLFFGNGEGAFGERVVYKTGDSSHGIVVADLSGDGAPEIVVSDAAPGTLILRNDGSGVFVPTEDVLPGCDIRTALLADLDGQYGLDIVRVRADNLRDVAVALNNGEGAFSPATRSHEVARRPESLTLGDLNGDEALDAVIAYRRYEPVSEAGVAILSNDDAGGFHDTTYHRTSEVEAIDTALGDLNGDGWLDLVLLHDSTDGQDAAVAVLSNGGTGGFAEPHLYPCGPDPAYIELVELSGDGLLDVVVNAWPSGEALVLINEGDATFGEPAHYAAKAWPRLLDFADFDGDGSIDLALGDSDADEIAIYWNDGTGSLNVIDRFATDPDPEDIVVADIDGNGWDDLVVACHGSETVQVFLNDTDGSFSVVTSETADARQVAVADLDGDGRLDVVYASRDGMYVLYQDANGDFARGVVGPLTDRRSVECIDVNADGRPDVAASSPNETEVTIFLNEGDREFAAPRTYLVGELAELPQWGDIDGDGLLDLVVVDHWGDAVLVHLNQCSEPCIGDVDGDGDTDQSDLGLLLASFGLLPDNPLFEPGADLTGDGVVDVADLGMLLGDYECGVGRGN